MHIFIKASKVFEEALARANQSIVSDILPSAERNELSQDSLSLRSAVGEEHDVISGKLCVNPIANQWWLEGLGSMHGGAFFISKTEKIRAEN